MPTQTAYISDLTTTRGDGQEINAQCGIAYDPGYNVPGTWEQDGTVTVTIEGVSVQADKIVFVIKDDMGNPGGTIAPSWTYTSEANSEAVKVVCDGSSDIQPYPPR